MFAARYGFAKLVRTLLSVGADVNKNPSWGPGPLAIAAYNGHASVIDLLLEAGADVSLRDKLEKKTPLDFAQDGGHGDIAALLRKRMRRAVGPTEEAKEETS
jgi:ankyrin repeat protein